MAQIKTAKGRIMCRDARVIFPRNDFCRPVVNRAWWSNQYIHLDLEKHKNSGQDSHLKRKIIKELQEEIHSEL
jgi:hypothetical protein